jgi:hypothetical protein
MPPEAAFPKHKTEPRPAAPHLLGREFEAPALWRKLQNQMQIRSTSGRDLFREMDRQGAAHRVARLYLVWRDAIIPTDSTVPSRRFSSIPFDV